MSYQRLISTARPRGAKPRSFLPVLSFVVVLSLVSVASASAETLLIEGGTLHTLTGAEPTVGSVLIQDGRIAEIGPDVTAPADARRIDATGKHVYPGLFDALSQIGLIEISSISATTDAAEIGRFNPHLRAASAIHPASEVIPVTRANGITHIVTAPSSGGGGFGGGASGVIPGQAVAVHLDGWTVEEMTLETDIAMILDWPDIQTRTFDFSTFSMKSAPYTDAKKKAEEAREDLLDWLDAARHYARAIDASTARTPRDLKLEALVPMIEGRQKAVVFANAKADIESAIEFCEEQGIDMILAGAKEAWMVADLLAEKQIPVVLGLTMDLPQEEDDPYDRPFRTAGRLAEAGVTFALGSNAGGGQGPGGPHSARTLPYEAAMTASFGLTEEQALHALTTAPARIFGLADQIGTLEKGKIANLLVTTGSPLEITTQIEHLIIQGRETSTENRHQQLYERYRSRPTE